MAEAPKDTAPSVVENKPDPEFDPATVPNPLGTQPQPAGVVPAGASAPGQESVSVEENQPDTDPPPPQQQSAEGPVAAGANDPDEIAPSVVGTSQDPNRAAT